MLRWSMGALGVLLLGLSFATFAWGPVDAHVTGIQPMPVGSTTAGVSFYFILDQNVGTGCPGGGGCCAANTDWLIYVPPSFSQSEPAETIREQSNVKAILSVVQMSVVLGLKVRLWGNDKAGGYCQLTTLELLTTNQ